LRPPGARCTDIVTLYLSSAPVNIVIDLALLFISFSILISMRLSRNEKIILIVIFSFGAFVAVIDVIRLAYLQFASVTRLQQSFSSKGKDDFS
jgi:ABC-type transport system involved in multi-copper enzyme maturation permease subunit